MRRSTPEQVQQQLDLLLQMPPSRDFWAAHMVRDHDWSIFDGKLKQLAHMKPQLTAGLDKILVKHQALLFSPFFQMETDEFDEVRKSLTVISNNLLSIKNTLVTDVPETISDKSTIKRARLALKKRGQKFEEEQEAISPEEFQDALTRFNVHLRNQLLEQFMIEKRGRGHKKPAPLVVFAWMANLGRWAKRAADAKARLDAAADTWSAKVQDAAEANFIMDVWELWKPHLANMPRTKKGRRIVESPRSPLFLAFVRNILGEFPGWRKRKHKTLSKEVLRLLVENPPTK